MKTVMQALLLSGAVAIASTAIAPAAFAEMGISVNLGDVSIGYRDGYYDSHHRWHHWAHPDDYKTYGQAHPEHYRDYGHNDRGHHDDNGH